MQKRGLPTVQKTGTVYEPTFRPLWRGGLPTVKNQVRFTDAGGMYLQVSPAGSKRWFLKFRIADVEKQLALGKLPRGDPDSGAQSP